MDAEEAKRAPEKAANLLLSARNWLKDPPPRNWRTDLSNLWWLMGRTKQALPFGIAACVLGVAQSGIALVMPQFVGRMIDVGLLQRDIGAFLSSVLLIGCGGVITLGCSQVSGYVLHRYTMSRHKLLACFIYERILACPYSEFIQHKPGQIERTLKELLSVLIAVDFVTIGQFIISIGKTMVLLFVLIWMSWQLALIAVGLVSLDFASTWISEKMRLRHRHAGRVVDAESSGETVEAFQSIQLIKACQAEAYEVNAFGRWRDKAIDVGHKQFRLSAVTTSIRTALSAGNKFVLLLAGGIGFLKNASVSLGDLSIFTLYVGQMSSGVRGCGEKTIQLRESFTVLDAARRALDAQAASRTRCELRMLPRSDDGTALIMREVSFAYVPRSGNPIINRVTLRLKSGRTVGIVGATGNGKSTLCHLLAGLYEPTDGTISFFMPDDDNGSIGKRPFVGFVPQNVILMGRTVRENLTYHCFDHGSVTDEQIMSVLSACQAVQIIEAFPSRLDTVLLDRHNALSGGERQRLAIAREVLARPHVLVLDEATSGLDLAMEKRVMQGIREVLPEAAIVFVSHRREMFQFCNEVYSLSDGTLLMMEQRWKPGCAMGEQMGTEQPTHAGQQTFSRR